MSGQTILVVDDEVGIVSFLYDFFTCRGYTVLQATSGKKAVQVAAKEHPKIVLLDIKLGWGKDGVKVLQEIKEISPDTKVIMMTGVTDEESIKQACSLGAEDYITKPLSLSYLEKVVLHKIVNLEIAHFGESVSVDESKESV